MHYLALTSIFFAAVIAADRRRLDFAINGHLAAALVTTLAGILDYLRLFPYGEIFTRFGGARGVFDDPNVYAVFLILPILCCQHTLMT